MKPTSLNRQMLTALDKIRHGTRSLPTYGLTPRDCEQMLKGMTDPLLEGAGLRFSILNQYGWFVRELSRLFRTCSGPDLAFCIEASIRKWQNFGLETNTLQFLVCRIYERLAQDDAGGV